MWLKAGFLLTHHTMQHIIALQQAVWWTCECRADGRVQNACMNVKICNVNQEIITTDWRLMAIIMMMITLIEWVLRENKYYTLLRPYHFNIKLAYFCLHINLSVSLCLSNSEGDTFYLGNTWIKMTASCISFSFKITRLTQTYRHITLLYFPFNTPLLLLTLSVDLTYWTRRSACLGACTFLPTPTPHHYKPFKNPHKENTK